MGDTRVLKLMPCSFFRPGSARAEIDLALTKAPTAGAHGYEIDDLAAVAKSWQLHHLHEVLFRGSGSTA